MSKFIVRSAKRTDMDAIGAIIFNNYHEVYKHILDKRYLASITVESAKLRMEAYFLTPGNEMFVAENFDEEENSKVVGFVSGTPSPDVLGAFWVEELHVDEKFRGQGVGHDLFFKMAQNSKATGYSQLVTNVFACNTKAEDICSHYEARFIESFHQDVEGFGVFSSIYIWDDLTKFENN